MVEFKKPGFPIIKLHEDSFEIKAIDFWEFRTFLYSEVIKIKLYKSDSSLFFGPISYLAIQEIEPFKLKIYKENGADWTYEAPAKEDPEFISFINEIKKRCRIS